MLKLKYILFVYLIISKIQIQTQYVFMLTFIANYYWKITTKNTNKHTYTLTRADIQRMYRLICIQVHKHNNLPVYS